MSFSERSHHLIKKVSDILIRKKKSLAIAESCTGGKIASLITSFPGSSLYFNGGIVAYNNSIKINQLGVDLVDLKKYSAVSDKVAIQMANKIRNKFSADLSISTTGYAGPDGNKVGQVFIGFSTSEKEYVKEFLFKGSRLDIIDESVYQGLSILLSKIKK
jgi:nicotinamide-nucleotide amidase